MLDKNSIIPLYIQLEKVLLDEIESGELKAGDIVPSENQLSLKYSISRMTAKKAIDSLTAKGFLERVRGKGTFVLGKEEKIELPLNRLKSFTEKLKEFNLVAKNEVTVLKKIKADEKISKLLKIKKEEEVWYMERVRKIENIPAVFEKSYIAVNLLPNLTKESLLGSKYEYVKKMGFEICDSDREILAEIPDDYVASLLYLKRNEPVLLAKCLTYLKKGIVLEYSEIFYNQKKYRFKLYVD